MPASDRAAATTALEGAGFNVRLDLDYPVDAGTTALELEIAYPTAESHDVQADYQAIALRDKTLQDVGIEFQHLSNGVHSGPSLSTYIVRRRNDPDGGERTVLAKDWNQFLSVYGAAYGDFDEGELEVSVVGLAANDPRN
ncbi:hypothetical protein ASPU41_20925 (plasmid) [Arthrobacter sp. U41]|nr:hypothetical protein ASPU41_20925 [Arthrobacter sp. U41]